MLKTTFFCAIIAVANTQPPSPFGFSYGGRPSSGSPFGGGGPSSPFGGGGPSSSPFGGGGPSPSPFGGGGPSSSSFIGAAPSSSSSPFSSGPPSHVASLGPPRGSRPGSSFSPPGFGKPPRQSSPSKLFSWLGNTMSKIPGLVPKIHYHNPGKAKPQSSLGGPPSNPSTPLRDSGILSQLPNSIFDESSSPYGGSSVSFAPSSGSPSHATVNYRSPSGPPPPGFGGRPRGPPPSYASRPPSSFGSRPLPSFSPSFSSGGPGPSPYSGPPSPFASSGSPFRGPPPSSSGFPQNIRNNLEVFPSQQISYQSQTLNQNEPGYKDALTSLQNIYASSSNKKPSYSGSSHYQQQTSYSQQQNTYNQQQPQTSASTTSNNYGATFHSVEPVRVAPIYDVNQNFKASSADLSVSESTKVQQAQQQSGNIHDTPFVSLVNDYSAQADAATSGSEQMVSALQGSSDMLTSASTNVPLSGMKILGQGMSMEGNPMFEVVADANAPTYDGHPVDLNKLISMIEPGAEIDTMPSYGDAEVGASSEQQPTYVEAPAGMMMESDAIMSSGLLSGNKKLEPGASSQSKIFIPSPTDPIQFLSSESRPTVVKLDGTRLNDEQLIKEHFDKEIIVDDLQENKDSGFIILRMGPDNQTGDDDNNSDLFKPLPQQTNGTLSSITSNDKDIITKDDSLLAIIQQLRKSALVNTLENPSLRVVAQTENTTTSDQNHPNHNYNPNIHLTLTNETLVETSDDIQTDLPPSPPPPKINPIFDSVRPSRIRFSKSSTSSVAISTFDENNNNNSTDSYSDSLPADNDDTGENSDETDDIEDMIESADDLAASASRNVKSVAIIVTPPPNYVKIRNKYKKASIPMSALTSITTVLPPTGLSSNNEQILSSKETFSESLSNNADRNHNNSLGKNDSSSDIPSNYSSNPTPSTAYFSSLEKTNDEVESDGETTDAFLKSILSGFQSSQSNSSSNTTDNGETKTEMKKPRRYPVYRGKTTTS